MGAKTPKSDTSDTQRLHTYESLLEEAAIRALTTHSMALEPATKDMVRKLTLKPVSIQHGMLVSLLGEDAVDYHVRGYLSRLRGRLMDAARVERDGHLNLGDRPEQSDGYTSPDLSCDKEMPRSAGDRKMHATRPFRAAGGRSPSQRSIKIVGQVNQKIALTVLDSFRVRDGRAIGDVRISELEGMRTSNVREAALLRLIQRDVGGYAPEGAKVRDLIDVEKMQRFIQKAAEVADAA